MLGNTVNFISSQMSNGSMDADLVQSVGTSLFSGIGNVLSAASSGARTDSEEPREDEEAQLEEDQADSEAMKEKVSDAFNFFSRYACCCRYYRSCAILGQIAFVFPPFVRG